MMNTNLVDIAKGYFSRDVVSKLSGQLGESPEKTQKAFNGAVPTIFSGLIQRADDAPGAGGGLANLLASNPTDGRMLDNFAGMLDNGPGADSLLSRGQGLLNGIFGNRLGDTVDGIAKTSGVSRGASTKILAVAAPLVAALIGREARSRGLGPAGIAGLLKGQKGFATSALGALGLGGAGARANDAYEEVHQTIRKNVPVEPTKVWHRMGAGLPLLLLGALALLGLFLFMRGRSRPEVTQAPALPQTSEVSITGAEVSKVETPVVEAPRLEAPAAAVAVEETVNPTGTRAEALVLEEYDVARSDKVAPEGKTALDRLARDLEANPDSKVKIEGYTDSTGSAEFNAKLSLDRANSIRSMLVARGVDSSRIETAGNGSSDPVSDNDSSEGRAKNRRVELTIYSP